MSEFLEFPKIARLSRECVITEKIDGTNAQIHICTTAQAVMLGVHATHELARTAGIGCDQLMLAGSRSRYIIAEKDGAHGDNFGFATWVKANADALWHLGEGRHYGEWWGSGIQRGYGLQNGEKRFSLFNVARWADDRDREKFPRDRPACCGVVPVLHRGDFGTVEIDSCLDLLRSDGSMAAPGFKKPEGIVIFHTAASVMFKKTLEKDAEGKEQQERRKALA